MNGTDPTGDYQEGLPLPCGAMCGGPYGVDDHSSSGQKSKSKSGAGPPAKAKNCGTLCQAGQFASSPNGIADRILPNGSTIRQNVKETTDETTQMIQDVAQAGGDPTAAVYGWFLGKVGPGGPWAAPLGEPGGNQNYGATGRAAGIPLNILLRAAGAAEQLEGLTGRTGGSSTGQGNPFGGPPYGDNPEGQAQIKQGYNAGL